jgi:DNA primase
MGKISPIAAKYIVFADIEVDGVVEKPDAVGAIFGQTEGLLGPDLELRELQKSGRLGRIDVSLKSKSGKSVGVITIPSSLDKSETAIIAAALETIDRIGPCCAKIKVNRVEDVRAAKRRYTIGRAKEILAQMMKDVIPNSQELSESVKIAVRTKELSEYGPEKLPAGPNVLTSDTIIIVEGRADVINLLKHGFKNVIAVEGTNIPPTIVQLCSVKTAIAFLDGDHGGDLILKELMSVAELDYVARAPAGKEVEELTKKEIHKALRVKIAVEQLESKSYHIYPYESKVKEEYPPRVPTPPVHEYFQTRWSQMLQKVDKSKVETFKKLLDDLMGTRGAIILDSNLNALGRIPVTELKKTLLSLEGIYAVVFDGVVTKKILAIAENRGIQYLVGMKLLGITRVPNYTIILTTKELESF